MNFVLGKTKSSLNPLFDKDGQLFVKWIRTKVLKKMP